MAISAKILVISVIGLNFICRAVGDPNTSVVDKICNVGHFGPDDTFGTDLVSVLNDISRNTASKGYSYYSSRGLCYGYGACNGDLDNPDCTKYLNSKTEQINLECWFSIGAQLKLQDCRISHENCPFSGW
ncbi:hypothetical protein ACJRO7_030545 [Eucalyptus globulus]|uniref:Gnk2-homologous domain-containing protein n=1 Tax=Eucalyptus globulus TaxID=34317 RepID=A0ABD3JFA2_EUCGL